MPVNFTVSAVPTWFGRNGLPVAPENGIVSVCGKIGPWRGIVIDRGGTKLARSLVASKMFFTLAVGTPDATLITVRSRPPVGSLPFSMLTLTWIGFCTTASGFPW